MTDQPIETVRWCEMHGSAALPDDLMCEWKYLAINTPWVKDESGLCSIVSKLLVAVSDD